MNYIEFLEMVIDKGILAARSDYCNPKDENMLLGSIEGFEACRGKLPLELSALLADARKETQKAYAEEATDYWRIRSRESEIEWVCNVVSAAISNMGLAPIINPTARGVMAAARILAGGALLVTDEMSATDSALAKTQVVAP